MNVVNETNPFAQLAGQAASSESNSASDPGQLGQEQFLDLMVTQLRNQDPFKPMESGDFLGQLAQFGTVSGIGELKTAFSDLSTSLSSNQALQASNLVDREVLVPSDEVSVGDGGVVDAAVDLPAAADSVSVGVYDLSGQLVKRIDLGAQDAGLAEFSWEGSGEDGAAVPPGTYTLRSEASLGGETTAVDTLVADRVDSVSLPPGGGALMLELANQGTVDFSQIRKIG